MKLNFLFLAVVAVALLPAHAESTPDAPYGKNVMQDVKPYSGTFTYQASSPVAIQADGFSLVADSGSLQHNLAINITILPHKSGTDFPSRMVNVTSIGDGVRILPNGEHFGARYYWPPLGHWLSVDPLVHKYPWISPYAYCGWNPIGVVDQHGDSTRLWVETEGVGHTWITTGEGENMRVYSYGRYDDLGKDKSHFRSSTPYGDGVLLRLTGEDAKQYIDEKMSTTNAKCVVIPDISDDQMQNYYDKMFMSSNELPSNERSLYYLNPNAHVIDTYNLFNNNCTTKAILSINALGSSYFQQGFVPSSNGKGYELNMNTLFITPLGLSLFLKFK